MTQPTNQITHFVFDNDGVNLDSEGFAVDDAVQSIMAVLQRCGGEHSNALSYEDVALRVKGRAARR